MKLDRDATAQAPKGWQVWQVAYDPPLWQAIQAGACPFDSSALGRLKRSLAEAIEDAQKCASGPK